MEQIWRVISNGCSHKKSPEEESTVDWSKLQFYDEEPMKGIYLKFQYGEHKKEKFTDDFIAI